MKLTAKPKLTPSEEQRPLLHDTSQLANAACNAISELAWAEKTFNKLKLQKRCYYDIRETFGLSAQMTIRALGKVADFYQSDYRTFKGDSTRHVQSAGLTLQTRRMNRIVTHKSTEEKLKDLLQSTEILICTAESCTGGLIASRITDVSGSSAYMVGGVVSYSNSAKQSLLNVRQGTLMAYGAVSEPVAREMALGTKELFSADFAISVTGIAGPGGGTDEKPVGLTFIGLAKPDGTVDVQRYVWDGDRLENKMQSADAALHLLVEAIEAL